MARKRQKKKHEMDKRLVAIALSDKLSPGDKRALAEALLHSPEPAWAGQSFTPPGTILDEVVKRFEKYTEFPLELPFLITLLLVATVMLQKNITFRRKGRVHELAIWLVLLASSGAGKSFCAEEILKTLIKALSELGLGSEFFAKAIKDIIWNAGGCKSTAQWMVEWAGETIYNKNGDIIDETPSHNRSLALVDEVAFVFRDIKDPKHSLFGMYRNFLLAYAHEEIMHKTRSGGKLIVPKPAINFLGLGTPKTFLKQISEEDIENGFFWRWGIVIASEPRDMYGKCDYPEDMLDGIDELWKNLILSIKHQQYVASPEAIAYCEEIFNAMVVKSRGNEYIPRTFVRRVAWLLHKLAAVFHIVLGHGEEQYVGAPPYQWAERLLVVFTESVSVSLREVFEPESLRMLERIAGLVERRSAKGLATNARDAMRNIDGLNGKDAQLYLTLAKMPIDSPINLPKTQTGQGFPVGFTG